MKKQFLSVMVVALALLVASPAFALDLHQARKDKIVGETLDGYVEALKKSPETAALVEEVNEKRREEYETL